MKRNYKLEKLNNGETFKTKERGSSMAKIEDVCVGDIVYCCVHGYFYTHLVKGIGERGCLIGNNRGGINGWTKKIYGKVIEIL